MTNNSKHGEGYTKFYSSRSKELKHHFLVVKFTFF